MEKVVHVYECVFTCVRRRAEYHFFSEEGIRPHMVQQNSHITKDTSLGVVGRRPHNARENVLVPFRGKIGFYQLTERVSAQRNGRNRAVGTMVKNVVEMTNELYDTSVSSSTTTSRSLRHNSLGPLSPPLPRTGSSGCIKTTPAPTWSTTTLSQGPR